jgi:pilus assembly protein CpaB
MKPARILVLVIALAAGGIAALLAGRSNTPAPATIVAQIETVDILVAGRDIGLGSTVSGEDLRWQTWPAAGISSHFIRKNDRADAAEQLTGSLARQAFSAGEPIRDDKLIKAQGSGYMAAILPQGKRAISVEISAETGAGGFILPNDHVDVILARRDRQSDNASGGNANATETILSNVRVLAIDQTIEEKDGKRVVVGKTATLELAPSQAETLVHSKQMGALTLALRSIVDFETAAESDADSDSRRGINVVRFGVGSTATAK